MGHTIPLAASLQLQTSNGLFQPERWNLAERFDGPLMTRRAFLAALSIGRDCEPIIKEAGECGPAYEYAARTRYGHGRTVPVSCSPLTKMMRGSP